MILTQKSINRRFHGSVDFDTFYLLAIIPRKDKNAIMLLVPKDRSKDKFFNLRYGNYSTWYCSIDHLLDAAREYCKLGRFRCWLYRRRYFKLTGRK